LQCKVGEDEEIDMSDVARLPSEVMAKIQFRSMGVKLIVVCGLALVMVIPALFVWALVEDRTHRAKDVVNEISQYAGGQQTFLGPTLAIPYTVPAASPSEGTRHGIYLVFPSRANGAVKVATQERHRSLFKVPVFRADVELSGNFDLSGVPVAAPPGAALQWDEAEIVVGTSDARGALADAVLMASGKALTMFPATVAQNLSVGGEGSSLVKLTLLGAKPDGVLEPNAKFDVTAKLNFSGAQRIAVLAYGKTTELSMKGDWPNPGFDGGFLPTAREVSKTGFDAKWSVPFIARGVRAEGPAESMTGLDATALGVSFVEVTDPYQSVTRSLKYVVLFLGLIFISYFVFEVLAGRRVHPAQYLLVGIAQLIFYLLLLSLAERIGFDWGFLAAGGATVTLLSLNAGWIFASRKYGFHALATFSVLYMLIYLLLRLEDNALLVGAVASFLAVAAAMYCTRRIDWYSSTASGQSNPGTTAAQSRS
jgi:inner membrane protein